MQGTTDTRSRGVQVDANTCTNLDREPRKWVHGDARTWSERGAIGCKWTLVDAQVSIERGVGGCEGMQADPWIESVATGYTRMHALGARGRSWMHMDAGGCISLDRDACKWMHGDADT